MMLIFDLHMYTCTQDDHIHESETADHIQAAYFSTNHTGYSGQGYISLSDPDSFVEWNITVSDPHLYSIQFRHQNADNKAQIDLFIDGSWRKSFDLPDTGYDYWVDSEKLHVPLSSGNHSIHVKTRDAIGPSIVSWDLLK